MTTRPLLDTHIVLWLDSGDAALRPATRTMLEEAATPHRYPLADVKRRPSIAVGAVASGQ